MAEEGHRVTLNVYDLSQGLARQMSMAFIGKAIEGIWHTGVLVYGNEYYFGGGIQHAPAGSTPYGTPIHVVELGETHVPKDVFEAYIQEISPQYTAETYSLLTHNCNNFSNEVAQFLVGATIPDYILQLPNEVMSSPMGALILPMIQNLEAILKSGVIQVENVPSGRFFQKGFRLLGKCLQFRPPSMVQPKTNGMKPLSTSNIVTADKSKSGGQLTKPEENGKRAAVKPKNGVVDPLGDARSKVQEEIAAEFATLMASGTLRASEAAALATRKVMERYGHANSPISQS